MPNSPFDRHRHCPAKNPAMPAVVGMNSKERKALAEAIKQLPGNKLARFEFENSQWRGMRRDKN
jgi:hypothetical protein